MEDPILDNDPTRPSPVEQEIPTAVASSSSWNTRMLLAYAVVGLAVVFVFRGRTHKPPEPAENVDANTYPPMPPESSPLQAIQTMIPPAALQHDDAESLRDVRRKSPMVIFNNTMAGGGSAATPNDPDGSTVPMPPGFHPSKAANAHSTTLGDREFIIAQGKLIDAVLETAINTDQPGMLRALVTNDIYGDSGRTVLLPRGSRLIGQYDADVARGQSRVFVIWQRVIRPDGIDVPLDSGGTDALGQAGVAGNVNNHFWTMFGAATLLSIIGASASTVGVSPQDAANSLSTYRTSVSQGFGDAANTVLGTFVRIKPTITVHPGAVIKVFVARDLYFDPALLAAGQVQVIP